MSLPSIPVNEEVVAFGMPWHGLMVKPLAGESYVELASGRRIASPFFNADFYSGSTGLVDLGMPEPTIEATDPEAEFWKVFICDFSNNSINYWGRPGDLARSVRIGDRLVRLACRVVPTSFTDGRVRASAELYLDSIPVFFELDITPPAGNPSLFNYQASVVDITPDGRKWLFSITFTRYYATYPYAFRVETDDDEGLGSLVEVEFSSDFSVMTGRFVATYMDCVVGRNVTAQDGQPIASKMIWFTGDGVSGTWSEYGETEPPTPPYYPPSEAPAGTPVKSGFAYGEGSTTATSSRDLVVAGWYSAAGVAQAVTLRISRRQTLTAQKPVKHPAAEQWWSPFVREQRCDVRVKVGEGSFQDFFSVISVENQQPQSTSYSLQFSDTQFSDSETNLPVETSGVQGETIVPAAFARSEPAKPTGGFASGYGGMAYSGIWNAAWLSSNKVLTCIARVTGNDLFEYVLGPAVTPRGIINGDGSTGNVIPGHDRFAPNFDQSIWDDYACYTRAAYHPITGQVLRRQRGLNSFTWV